jgi:hypothetical protein
MRSIPRTRSGERLESNGLVLLQAEYEREPRDLDAYFDLADCEGEARERAETLAPPNYTADLGWYLLEKGGGRRTRGRRSRHAQSASSHA